MKVSLVNKLSNGFTLIELLVVISIVSLISSAVFSSAVEARKRARDASRIANARQLSIALEEHESAKGTYKVSGAGYQSSGGGLATKSGTADYATSLVSALKGEGVYSSGSLFDQVFQDDNYYVGLCDDGKQFNVFLKVEQDSLKHPENTVRAGCDGNTASSLGFNYIFGVGSSVAQGSSTSTAVADQFGGSIFSGPSIVFAQTASNGQVSYYTDATHISGTNNLFWDILNQRLGIGTMTPGTTLDVAGGVRAGGSDVVTTCAAGQAGGEGTMRYNYNAHAMQYCNGTQWVNAGGGQTSSPVYVHYIGTLGQATTHGVPVIVNYNSKVSDTLNTVTTGSNWKFTAPTSGIYRISAAIATAAYAWGNAGASIWLNTMKNGADYRRLNSYYVVMSGTAGVTLTGANTLDLAAGDTLAVGVTIWRGGTTNLGSSGFDTWVTIERISDLP
ncbi:MAG TPA: type II secretion system protein [Candidatus Paceibacterota bacterium]|nr:type II secretion system protein [Candidatus Paceibacterota bacterium]